MTTPPPDAASAVTLWCCPDEPRYGKPMFSVDKCPTVEEADIEYRALPAASFDALLSRLARAESALREIVPDWLPESASEAAKCVEECATDIAIRLVRARAALSSPAAPGTGGTT